VQRRLRTSPDFRPLTSRALTCIIDTLRPHLSSRTILDLYSGSGRFGEAALREGAREVTFVERDRGLAGALRQLEGKVFPMDVLNFLKMAAEKRWQYDVVFADPPYRLWSSPFRDQLMGQVAEVIDCYSIFLVRQPKKMLASPTFPGYFVWKIRELGESRLAYLKLDGKKDFH